MNESSKRGMWSRTGMSTREPVPWKTLDDKVDEISITSESLWVQDYLKLKQRRNRQWNNL